MFYGHRPVNLQGVAVVVQFEAVLKEHGFSRAVSFAFSLRLFSR